MTADLPVPVFDNHVHLDPRGRRGEAVKDFARSGGTHMMLVHKPYGDVNRSVDDHVDAFGTTLDLAAQAREAADVDVWVALAPHPAEFPNLVDDGASVEEAADVYRGGLEAAADLVGERDDVVCLGEVGRPHWRPIDDEILETANELMEEAFALADELGVPAQVHAEEASREHFRDLAEHADAAGLARERVVRHYSPPAVDTDDNAGLFPSVLVGGDHAQEAARLGDRFVMETDYMDDPDRPGAVLGPKTVPKRTRHLLEEGIWGEEAAWAVHVENVRDLYGVEPPRNPA
jgi:TatD-related deoxyribonuclease